MVNLQVIGNLGRDAEMRNVNGKDICSFSLAHNDGYKNEKGEKISKTLWINCTIWNENLAKAVFPYLNQGAQIFAAGRMDVKVYKNKNSGQSMPDVRMNVESLTLVGGKKEGATKEDTDEQIPDYDPETGEVLDLTGANLPPVGADGLPF